MAAQRKAPSLRGRGTFLSRLPKPATGKSPEPAGWKARATTLVSPISKLAERWKWLARRRFRNLRYGRFGNLRYDFVTGRACSARLRVCGAAGHSCPAFRNRRLENRRNPQAGKPALRLWCRRFPNWQSAGNGWRDAGLETCDTADLEICATTLSLAVIRLFGGGIQPGQGLANGTRQRRDIIRFHQQALTVGGESGGVEFSAVPCGINDRQPRLIA